MQDKEDGGSSKGMDMYIQLFTNNHEPYRKLFVTYPDKALIEKRKTFNYNYNSNGSIPIEINTGFTKDDYVYDLTASTETN